LSRSGIVRFELLILPASPSFGEHAGGTLTVRVEPDCPVHNPREAARVVTDSPPVIAPAAEQETEEEAAQREAEHEQRMAEYRVEQERKEERKAEFERKQKEYEAEQARRDKQRKTRLATLSRATSARGSESCYVATGSLTPSDRVSRVRQHSRPVYHQDLAL
jgi:hypothetical protein